MTLNGCSFTTSVQVARAFGAQRRVLPARNCRWFVFFYLSSTFILFELNRCSNRSDPPARSHGGGDVASAAAPSTPPRRNTTIVFDEFFFGGNDDGGGTLEAWTYTRGLHSSTFQLNLSLI